jgi:2-iminobutanoate/2-iminopropanoate deaminase
MIQPLFVGYNGAYQAGRHLEGGNMKRHLLTAGAVFCLTAGAVLMMGQATAKSGRHLDPAGRQDQRPFSHAVMAGGVLYLSGGLGIDPATGKPPVDVEEEIRLLLDGMKAKLALADMTMDDLVSVQIFCPDLTLYDQFNAIYSTYFSAGYPARAFVGSGPLLRGARFEVMGTAVRR